MDKGSGYGWGRVGRIGPVKWMEEIIYRGVEDWPGRTGVRLGVDCTRDESRSHNIMEESCSVIDKRRHNKSDQGV